VLVFLLARVFVVLDLVEWAVQVFSVKS